MARAALGLPFALAALAAPPALGEGGAGRAATAVAATPGAPRATLSACEKGAEEQDRAAAFTARMSAVPGSARLQVRFTLQTRADPGLRWRTVRAAGFQRWLTADPGVRRFVYAKRVEALLAPASYRASVAFRWRAADGNVVATATRATRTCTQPDLRPDLEPTGLTVTRAGPADATYVVTVANAGRSDAPASVLEVSAGAAAPVGAGVPALGAGDSTTVTVTGPACPPGTQATVVLDARDAVDDADEANDERTVACPEATAAAPYNGMQS